MKLFDIKYKKDSKELVATCSEHSLNMIRKDIENMGGSVVSIKMKTPLLPNRDKDPLKIEKNEYYRSRYNFFYKKHENGRINTELFKKIKDKLRELKEETKDKAEFQEKFEEYLKDNNIKIIKKQL